MWPVLTRPACWASAVAPSSGGKGSPVRARRGPSSAACSATRRLASARLVSVQSAIGMGELAAEFFGGGFLLELVDQRMFTGAQAPSHCLVAFQQGEPLLGAQHRAIEPDDVLECGVQRVALRGDPFSIKNGRTHTSN